MQRLFLSKEQIVEGIGYITGADHIHLARVLRARPGDTILLLDNLGNAFQAVLVTIDKERSTARIETGVSLLSEPPLFLTIAQALGRGDKFEQVIQHGTEAGASAFVPVHAERCVAEVPQGKREARLARWRLIAKGAAEQSGRARIPSIAEPISFPALAQKEDKEEPFLLLHPAEEAMSLRTWIEALVALPERMTLLVGPEGGWSPAEIALAQEAKWPCVALGPRVLRTETAALVAISQIIYHFER